MITANMVLIGLVILLILIVIYAKFYQRSSKDVAFVRTGFGGERIVLTGGALAIPIIHQTTPVNMSTLRLVVERAREKGLVTKDKMRVDIETAFYVRVAGTREGVALAAQTLGPRTLNPQSIQELMSGKFVDAMRAATAEMTLDELHSDAKGFTDRVAEMIHGAVTMNGLELESVSLSNMDQTEKQYFDPNNTFDAEGLIKITRETEESRKTRNEIERASELKIEQTNLAAEEKSLEVKRQSEYARMQTDYEIAQRRASQAADIAKAQAESTRQSSEAEIAETETVEKLRLASEQTVSMERIATERTLREAELEKSKTLEVMEIDRQRALKIAEQEREIALLAKQQERAKVSEATRSAEAKAATAEEQVDTAREVARAEREKAVAELKSQRVAQEKAIATKIAAQAEKLAAQDLASAKEVIANAEAAAERVRRLAEAEGRQRINEAANILSSEQVDMQVKLDTIKALPDIIRESVKPIENIDGIKIIDVGGLNGESTTSGNGDDGSGAGRPAGGDDGNLVDRAVSGALRYRTHAPILDSLIQEVGLVQGSETLTSLVSGKSSLASGKPIGPKKRI
ncbi:flotillin family protein [Roseobacter weihaiensis]|uniref:flotillin family protein n=1 Tax=Roseobacter weihaiensis TaxID=2763262 RepID=UPI001D0B0AA6|nr:flotillin domain-containing protein [Roseobacter sp. H9]